MKAFRDVEDQERFFRRSQVDKYTHLYTATFLVPYAPANDTPRLRSAIMQVEEDAAFHVTHLIGSVIDSVQSSSLQRYPIGDISLFPMAGTTDERADRGIDFKLSDPGSGRTMTGVTNSRNITLEGAYIPFAAVFPSGYSFRFREPVPFDYFIEKKRRLLIEVRNRNWFDPVEIPVADYSARVTFGFLGHRVNS